MMHDATPVAVVFVYFFFFNDTATTEIYTLSLHDALPILAVGIKGHVIVETDTLLFLLTNTP